MIVLIIFYAMLLTTCFICHDVWYEEAVVEYLASNVAVADDLTSDSAVGQRILFVTELVALALLTIDMIALAIGYGFLYLRRP